jgi:hypothetical protein
MTYRQSRFVTAPVFATSAFLVAGCGMRHLEGTVAGADTQPLAGCAVMLLAGTNGGLQLTRTTDDSGKFSFGSVGTLGGCRIRIDKPGYDSLDVPCPPDGTPIRVTMIKHGSAI